MANSPARAVLDVGSVIADTYRIDALLGRGGMGAVFRASHQRLAGKQVAIKVLHTEIEDPEVIARFKREAEIAAKLNHPNVVGVIDYNVAPDGTPYLVLDYLEGETLAQRIAAGPMPLEQVLSIVRQVGAGLAAAHRAGIVHRDLKPQNIFLVPTIVDGRELEIAKVLDFGISKIRGSQTVKTQESTLLGTPQYMAPEQATGQHAAVDERTDVFALGAIVHEMLSGQPAFSGASIPEVVFKVVYEQPAPLAALAPMTPPAILAAVATAMAKQPDERFPTVAAFVEAVTGQPLTVTRAQPIAAPQGAESPSAARRVATREAFAQTMGSGNFGDSPVNPHLATMAPGAIAPTLGLPSPTTTSPPSPGIPAPTVDLRAPSAPRSKAGWLAGVALAGAAIAAGAVYFAMRPTQTAVATTSAPATGDRRGSAAEALHGGSASANLAPDAKPAAPDVTSAAPDAKPATPDAKPAAPDAKPAAPDAKPAAPDAKPAAPDVKPQPPARGKTSAKPAQDLPPAAPPDESGDAGDDDARAKLQQAAAALDRRDYDAAERLANAVINSHASGKQQAAARVIHGTVQCAARNDQEAAQIDLRALAGFRAMRARLLAVCKRHGVIAP